MLKVTKSSFVGRKTEEILPPKTAKIINKIDATVMQTNTAKILEESGFAADGSPAVYLTHKIPLHDQDGKVTGLLGVSIDITEKKKLEEKLHQAELEKRAQEERIKTMRAMAAGIAHELKTPLSSISAAASSIVKFFPRLIKAYHIAKQAELPLPSIQERHFSLLEESLANIENESDYAQSVISMMLTAARHSQINSNDLEPLSMHGCVDKALSRYAYRHAKDRTLITFKASYDFEFYGNEILMINILFNLIKNALFFIHKADKGSIEIWLESTDQANYLHFKDTATGISPDTLPHIFEEFYSDREGGTGIGLSFCKKVMESFNGSITCHSEEGSFAHFILEFPVH